MEKEKKLSSEEIFQGKILHLTRDHVLCPNGHESTRELVHHIGAACVVAIKNGKILIEKQYRYPFDDFLLELPAGKLEKGEAPEIAAARELEEETGYKANKLTYLGPLYPTVAYSNEVIHMYLGEELVKTKTNWDEDENIELLEMTLDELVSLIMEGKIQDSKTIAGILKYKYLKNL